MNGPSKEDHAKLEKFHDRIRAGEQIKWEKIKGLSEFEKHILDIISQDVKEMKSFWLEDNIVIYSTGVKDVPYCCVFHDRWFVWFDEKDSIHPDQALQIGLSRMGIDSKLIIRDDGTTILQAGDIIVVDERRKDGQEDD